MLINRIKESDVTKSVKDRITGKLVMWNNTRMIKLQPCNIIFVYVDIISFFIPPFE